MFDKIITVTLNPALDVTLWLNALDFVEPNETAREVLYAGKKGPGAGIPGGSRQGAGHLRQR